MLRNVRLLYIHNFLNRFRFDMPYLVIYFASITHSYTVAMAIVSVGTITGAIMDIPTGMLSDRLGRRLTFALGSFVTALGIAFYAFANGSIFLFIGSFCTGLGLCLFSGNNDALLYETLKSVKQEDRFHYYSGRATGLWQLGLGLSGFLSSFLAARNLHIAFLASLVPQTMAMIVSFLFDEPRVEHVKPKTFSLFFGAWRHIFRNKKLLLMMIGNTMSYGGTEAVFDSQTVYVNGLWPTWAIGIFRGLVNGFQAVSSWFAGPFIRHFKESRIVIFREIYRFAAMSAAILLNQFISPVLMSTTSLVSGPAQVARNHLMQREFTDEQRATLGSISSSVSSILYALIALGVGIISDHFGIIAGMEFAVAFHLAAIPFFVRVFR